jgi:hypothetical protein
MRRFFTSLLCFFVSFAAFLTSCQKDENVEKAETQLQVDTIAKVGPVSAAPGNFLANKGMLTVKFQDSTYTFDAAQDSVVLVNIVIEGNQYYGITAINKAHTVSFGISSPGIPIDGMDTFVSGAQFLLNPAGKKNLEYTLMPNSQPTNYGTISIEKYNQDSTLAKGTFHSVLSRDTKSNSPSSVVEGSFELKVK